MPAWAGQVLQVTGGGGAMAGSATTVVEAGEVVDVDDGVDPHAAAGLFYEPKYLGQGLRPPRVCST